MIRRFYRTGSRLNQRKNEKTPISEAGKVNLTRATVYSFLSKAFKIEVDERFLRDVVEIEPILGILSGSEASRELEEGRALLVEFAKQSKDLSGKKKEEFLTDLAAEYAGLFLGVGEKTVPLAESFYLSKDHLLYQQPYHEIIQAYRSLGYEKEKGFREPEDHVAVEFDFMATLCMWTSKSLDEGDVNKAIAYLNLQKEFLRDHLNKWVPRMCNRLGRAATSSLYKGLAKLTKGFVAMDDEIPDHLTETLKSM